MVRYCLRFDSFGCSIWTNYSSFESSWPADFDLSQFWIKSQGLSAIILSEIHPLTLPYPLAANDAHRLNSACI